MGDTLDALCLVCLLISEFGPLLITAADVAAAALCSIIFDFQDIFGQAIIDVLYKSHFSFQMGNCPIPIAEHFGQGRQILLPAPHDKYAPALT